MLNRIIIFNFIDAGKLSELFHNNKESGASATLFLSENSIWPHCIVDIAQQYDWTLQLIRVFFFFFFFFFFAASIFTERNSCR